MEVVDILDSDVFGFFNYSKFITTPSINLWLEQFSIESLNCLYYLTNAKKYRTTNHYKHINCTCGTKYEKYYTKFINNFSFPFCISEQKICIPKYTIPTSTPFIGFNIDYNSILIPTRTGSPNIEPFEKLTGTSLIQYFDWYVNNTIPNFLYYLFLIKLKTKKKSLLQLVPSNWRILDRRKFRTVQTTPTQSLSLWSSYKTNNNLSYDDVNVFCMWKKRPKITNQYISDSIIQYNYNVPILIFDSIDDFYKLFDLYGNLIFKRKNKTWLKGTQKLNATFLIAIIDNKYIILDIYRLNNINIFQFPFFERLLFIDKFMTLVDNSKFEKAPIIDFIQLTYLENKYYKNLTKYSIFKMPYNGFIFKTNNDEFVYKFEETIINVFTETETFTISSNNVIPKGIVVPLSLPPYYYKFLCCCDNNYIYVLIFDRFRFRVYFKLSVSVLVNNPEKFYTKIIDFLNEKKKMNCFIAKLYFNTFNGIPDDIVAVIPNIYYSLYDVVSTFRLEQKEKFWKITQN